MCLIWLKPWRVNLIPFLSVSKSGSKTQTISYLPLYFLYGSIKKTTSKSYIFLFQLGRSKKTFFV
jgi:hypothetical protein